MMTKRTKALLLAGLALLAAGVIDNMAWSG